MADAAGAAKGALGTAWKFVKPALIGLSIFSIVALTAGGGAAVVGGSTLAQTGATGLSLKSAAMLPIEGVVESANIISNGASWVAGKIGTAAGAQTLAGSTAGTTALFNSTATGLSASGWTTTATLPPPFNVSPMSWVSP